MLKGSKYTVQNQIYLIAHMSKESKVPCDNSNNSNILIVCMSKESKVPCDDSYNSNISICIHVKRVESTVHSLFL